MSISIGAPPFGLQLDEVRAVCFNRTNAATAVGDVVELDLTQGSEADNSRVGNSLSSLANVVQTETSTDLTISIYGVALEVIADNASGLFGFRGIFDVNVPGTATAGQSLMPQDANARLVDYAANGRVIAIALEVDVSNIAPCLFDGVHGFAGAA